MRRLLTAAPLQRSMQVAAYAYRDYLDGCDASAYLGAEAQAEHFRQEVWRWGNEVKPWNFRRKEKKCTRDHNTMI
jgi:hypothetical protein